MLPELTPAHHADTPLAREYSSGDTPVGLEQTIALLRENQLMLDQVDVAAEGELLR